MIEYYSHTWSGAPSIYLEIPVEIQRMVSNIIGPDQICQLSHVYDISSVCFFYTHFQCRYSNKLSSLARPAEEFKCTIR